MKEYKKGERGRIPNRIKLRVAEDIKKHGFYLAWHYFAYDCDFGNLTDYDIQTWRAFDQYERTHRITDKPLISSNDMAEILNAKNIKQIAKQICM